MFFFLIALICKTAPAHYIWIEAAEKWTAGKPETIKIYYGKYAEGAREEAEKRLEEVNGLTAWLVVPGGEKINLSLQKMGNHFLAEYTPKQAGKFEIEVISLEREVVDWTQYDVGVVRPTYYAHKPLYVEGNVDSDPLIASQKPTSVVPSRIELEYQVPETCVLSIVLRDQLIL